jgi:aryl-alcohol dehydrogenase-like predicted oxidoreductase
MFRQRPHEFFFKRAAERNVGIIVRVPLASGLLTGKFSKKSSFEPGDHRNFNRNGEMFDKGETFSGIPFDVGIDAVEELKKRLPVEMTLTDLALKWILMKKEVSCIIPGASRTEQVHTNMKAMHLPALEESMLKEIDHIYEKYIKNYVHQLW